MNTQTKLPNKVILKAIEDELESVDTVRKALHGNRILTHQYGESNKDEVFDVINELNSNPSVGGKKQLHHTKVWDTAQKIFQSGQRAHFKQLANETRKRELEIERKRKRMKLMNQARASQVDHQQKDAGSNIEEKSHWVKKDTDH